MTKRIATYTLQSIKETKKSETKYTIKNSNEILILMLKYFSYTIHQVKKYGVFSLGF